MQDDETLESGDPQPAVSAVPGGHVGKYEIVRALGAGGMGVVWAARDPDLDREVAIKLLRGDRASPEQRTRLLREARAMARLKHPNVLTVYEVASAGGRDFIVMEIVDGESLDIWLRGKPSERDVWDALIAAGRGLAAAHAAGLVHRDFKPHNVLRSREGRVLVTDFGLARGSIELADTHSSGAGDSLLDVQLTATGALLGTPAYMAPEQFDGDTDARTDQFGFCVTAWEALAGARPYEGTTIEQLREAARSGTPSRTATLPRGVRAVLARGLAPDPANRWPDMAALLSALERTRRVWPRRLAVVVPVVLVAGAAAAVLATRGHTAEKPCDADQAFASAWTPALRTAVTATHPDLAGFASHIDDYRAHWLAGYAQACHAPAAQRREKLECYGELRDELALQVELMQRYKDHLVGREDLIDLIGADDSCKNTASSRPPLPGDARRGKILAFLEKAYGALYGTGGMVGDFDALRAEAQAVGWPPLEARLEEMIAATTSDAGDYDVGQQAYRRAAELAAASHDRITEARARIGIVRLAGFAFEKDTPPSTGYETELREAQLAVQAAGDDDAMNALLDSVRAEHAAYVEGSLTKAITTDLQALSALMARDDVPGMTRIAATLVELVCVRSNADDLDLAARLLADVTARAQKSVAPGYVGDLRNARYWAAWLRGDLAAAHAPLDEIPIGAVPTGSTIAGRVVDTHGRPVAGARVAIWQGDMYGDALRVFTAPPNRATIPTTDASGTFHDVVPTGSGIIAELGDQRSPPMVAKDGIELVVAPTRAITGTVDAGGDRIAGIEPFVRIDVAPGLAWFVSVAPTPDGHFTIAGIPRAVASVRLGAIGSHWPRDGRSIDAGPAVDGAAIHWPLGDTVDIVVPPGVKSAWLLRGSVAPTTLAELVKLTAAPDAIRGFANPIGWKNATIAGSVAYRAGSRHVVIHDVPHGMVTACVTQGTTVSCRAATAGDAPAAVRDGRHWPQGTAILF